jgi:hypothetical protein
MPLIAAEVMNKVLNYHLFSPNLFKNPSSRSSAGSGKTQWLIKEN